ncbi:MAG: histidine phosphatase family protein [Micromonosporaceae bacterium]|nr:histidine phosphatase family protein [Micromonosporaceae bacterium]
MDEANRWERVYLVRHGQTEWNVQGRRQGHLDSPLTATGIAQARGHAVALRSEAVDAIFTSPLGRARTTAAIIADGLGLGVVVIDDLAEVHHGHFAGLSNQDIELRYPGELARRAADKYRWRFPGGESYAGAEARAGRALASVSGYPARRPVIVAHEMIGRMLLRHLLGLGPEEALALRQPHDVIIVVDPPARTRWELRS